MNQHPLPPAGTNAAMSWLSRFVTGVVLPLLDSAVEASGKPFRQPEMMRPNTGSKRYGMTHFGVFLPGLPAPHKYCNIMTMLGTPGAVMFDNDYLIRGHPRDTATFLSSTAADSAHHYRAYSIARECQTREDGSLVAFGDDLEISGVYPRYQVRVAYGDFRLDITVECTDTVSWFVRNAVYDHLSLLARCSGEITHAGKTTPIDSLCTFEYARSASPHVLIDRVLPERWKLPADFFTYQIINLDESTQLLLTDVRALGKTGFKGVHVRALKGDAEVYVRDVIFQVTEYQDDLAIAPDGRTMRLPKTFSWSVREGGEPVLDIRCTIDSPWRFGHGRGYVACYRFEGQFRQRAHAGAGYIEYIDCETVSRSE
ncbi:hypothetical protein D0B54_05480 [Solimonas sp. K1W22B-7]|uniref:DUF6670 family protein n=1 Tax=Solimonas sp. K1W22B-7 TaxID=2303331 RepID=UPI000E32ED23|nr:DUF6670 family protein [Solimonas sp. K1W22B-7]AXQ28158.1 hypothetical protein D0B54_05480 [Solimonas sp. K1W22B-7]